MTAATSRSVEERSAWHQPDAQYAIHSSDRKTEPRTSSSSRIHALRSMGSSFGVAHSSSSSSRRLRTASSSSQSYSYYQFPLAHSASNSSSDERASASYSSHHALPLPFASASSSTRSLLQRRYASQCLRSRHTLSFASSNNSSSSSNRLLTQSFLSRSRFAKKCLGDALLLSNSRRSRDALKRQRASFSSSAASSPLAASHSQSFRRRHRARTTASHGDDETVAAAASACYVPVPVNPEAAAELEHDILLASSCGSSASVFDDAALVDLARMARRQVEHAAKRQVLVGKWKQRHVSTGRRRSSGDSDDSRCQVHESLTRRKDEYSVVAKMDLPCSLAEIQSVLSSSSSSGNTSGDSAAFHRSMAMLFGDQYVFGLNVRTVDCAPHRRSSSASSWSSATQSTMRRRTHSAPTLSSSRLAVNAVSLLMRRRLVWRQQTLSFIDYCDERPESKSVTRVLQTIDALDDDDNDDELDVEYGDDTEASMTAGHRSSSRPRASALQLHEQRRRVRGLRGLLVGYVLQEDSNAKFTRLFFYATHKPSSSDVAMASSRHKAPRVDALNVQLVREMVRKLCGLEAVVRRRRLGYYPLMSAPSDASPALLQPRPRASTTASALQCSSCYASFRPLFRAKHFCSLCGHYTCRKCSRVEPIEKVLGIVDFRRVCRSCVRRVSYCVFEPQDEPLYGRAYGSNDAKTLAHVPEEDAPPVLGDFESDDDLAATVVGDLALFPHEHLENDVAAAKVAQYLRTVLARDVGCSGSRPLFGVRHEERQQSGGGARDDEAEPECETEEEESDAIVTTPRDSICLLDSANGSRSSLESDALHVRFA